MNPRSTLACVFALLAALMWLQHAHATITINDDGTVNGVTYASETIGQGTGTLDGYGVLTDAVSPRTSDNPTCAHDAHNVAYDIPFSSIPDQSGHFEAGVDVEVYISLTGGAFGSSFNPIGYGDITFTGVQRGGAAGDANVIVEGRINSTVSGTDTARMELCLGTLAIAHGADAISFDFYVLEMSSPADSTTHHVTFTDAIQVRSGLDIAIEKNYVKIGRDHGYQGFDVGGRMQSFASIGAITLGHDGTLYNADTGSLVSSLTDLVTFYDAESTFTVSGDLDFDGHVWIEESQEDVASCSGAGRRSQFTEVTTTGATADADHLASNGGVNDICVEVQFNQTDELLYIGGGDYLLTLALNGRNGIVTLPEADASDESVESDGENEAVGYELGKIKWADVLVFFPSLMLLSKDFDSSARPPDYRYPTKIEQRIDICNRSGSSVSGGLAILDCGECGGPSDSATSYGGFDFTVTTGLDCTQLRPAQRTRWHRAGLPGIRKSFDAIMFLYEVDPEDVVVSLTTITDGSPNTDYFHLRTYAFH